MKGNAGVPGSEAMSEGGIYYLFALVAPVFITAVLYIGFSVLFLASPLVGLILTIGVWTVLIKRVWDGKQIPRRLFWIFELIMFKRIWWFQKKRDFEGAVKWNIQFAEID